MLERDDGGIVAVEVKVGTQLSTSDLTGLRSLRGLMGDAFLGGVVLNLGQRSYTIEPRIHVLPVDRLWTT